MIDNLEKIKKISNIIEVKRLQLNDEIKKLLGLKVVKDAEKNSKKIFIYEFFYISHGKKIKGYLIEPRKGNKLPCVIWNRGGSRDFESIKMESFFVSRSMITSLAMKGYIVIATQYPGVAGGEGVDKMGSEEDIDSILDLYKILKMYKRADTSSVGMYGHSRGGMMTYMCLARVNFVKAAVAIAALADEINAHKFRKWWAEHQKSMYGGSLEEKKKRSALLWTNKFHKKTPLLIMHGTADWRVNPNDSIRLAEKLYENKIPFRSILYEGADHWLTEVNNEYQKEVFKWFDRFLKNSENLPNIKPHGT